ncbi:DUF4251 domain-containing protein [Pedobacter jejuensis]|uniref:DUF4251 domain-containing protein n=1 Tax=Pedobacter jejuensis TaxID=1268550 RepID=A0A3N0BZ41_9SPHI|nr:DUF4251 domain-containing protein [Pedobacter jejuensis]RNL55090.1 DUF4251 domain-containing protein [Pedobacter jejuensis]
MKNIKFILSVLFTLTISQAFSQTDKETTMKIVADKNYVFTANSAMPLASNDINRILMQFPGGMSGGGTINLTGSQYDLKVTKDSIVAYLPYYGRAFNAPYNPNDGGIKFTSKNFTYKEDKAKKGGYTVSITTNDLKTENYQLFLRISQNGYASLMVNSVNKQAINFNGFLAEPKKKKPESL